MMMMMMMLIGHWLCNYSSPFPAAAAAETAAQPPDIKRRLIKLIWQQDEDKNLQCVCVSGITSATAEI